MPTMKHFAPKGYVAIAPKWACGRASECTDCDIDRDAGCRIFPGCSARVRPDKTEVIFKKEDPHAEISPARISRT